MPANPYTIILALFLVAGLATTVWGWTILARGKRTRQWPTVAGIVTRRAVADDASATQVDYCYTVAGHDHAGRNEIAGAHATDAAATVTVHYDPTHPERSTLEPGHKRGDWFVFALGLLTTFFGSIFLFFGGRP